jgi:hypothetical protein
MEVPRPPPQRGVPLLDLSVVEWHLAWDPVAEGVVIKEGAEAEGRYTRGLMVRSLSVDRLNWYLHNGQLYQNGHLYLFALRLHSHLGYPQARGIKISTRTEMGMRQLSTDWIMEALTRKGGARPRENQRRGVRVGEFECMVYLLLCLMSSV